MPTAYTAILDRQPETTLNDFVWRCARAMPPFGRQCDDPADAPPVMIEEPKEIYKAELDHALDRVKWLESASPDELLAEQFADRTEAVNRCAAGQLKSQRLLDSYRRMLAMVVSWQAPSTNHEWLKRFMIRQLADSINWERETSCYDEQAAAANLPVELYRASQLAAARHELASREHSLAEEIARVAACNEWKRQLAESIGMPPA